MNHIYRTLWNTALGACVAVAETAKGAGKGGSSRSRSAIADATESDGFTLKPACRAALVLLAALALLTPKAHAANAADATVSLGAGSVATTGNTTTVTQGSQRLAIDWTSLSTRANEALVFAQPNAQAIALNRITGSSPSELLGSLTANGQVFILNPNGVLFGAGSQVNVGGLVASTLSMSNADFQAGNHVFSNNGASGSVVNQGTLNAAPRGYLALLAPEVRNEGVMTASLGTALLAAGNKVTLNLDNGSLLGYSIDQGAINALAENKHLIQANGGQVLLSAKAMDSLTTATVNNTGVIEARTIQNKAGRILLMGDMEVGTVNVAGTLDASAPDGGDGGFVETSAAHVKVADSARVTTLASAGNTGKWLIDPNDFTISATGDMTAAAVAAALAGGNFEIQTASMGTAGGNGDIHVNQAIDRTDNNTFTLTAERDININTGANITKTNAGAAGMTMTAGRNILLNGRIGVGGPSTTLSVTANAAGDITGTGTLNTNNGAVDMTAGGGIGGADGLGQIFAGSLKLRATTGEVIVNSGVSWNANSFDLYAGTNIRGSNPGSAVDASMSGPGGSFAASAGNAGNGRIRVNAYGYAIGTLNLTTQGTGGGGQIDFTSNAAVSNATITAAHDVNASTTGNFNVASLNLTGSIQSVSLAANGGTLSLPTINIAGATLTGSGANVALNGALTAANVIFNASGNIALASNVNTTGTQTYNGILNITGPVTLTAGGDIGLGGLTGAGQSVALNSGGTITNTGATNVGTFTLAGGTWRQVGSVPAFSATDFRINGGTFIRALGGDGLSAGTAYQLTDIYGLQGAGSASMLNKSYTLANNVDASGTANWNSNAGFNPIGNVSSPFTSRFDGNGHTISNLTINRPAQDHVGLFGSADGAQISNVGVVGGSTIGRNQVGGLVGSAIGGTIINSYTTGDVSGFVRVGGLVGEINSAGGAITGSYATGDVSGSENVGGLVGLNSFGSVISNSYATGNVNGLDAYVGGLVGQNLSGSAISNSYATGNVSTGGTDADGLVGYNSGGTVSNSFHSATANPGLPDALGTGKTDGELKQASTFAGWDIASTGGSNAVWRIYEGQSMPLLRGFLSGLTLADTVLTYNGAVQTGASTAAVGVLGAASSGRNAGSYNGYYSGQQGYDISGGTLTVTPANLVLTTTNVSKTYNGLLDAAGVFTATGGTQLFDTDTATGGGFAFLDKNAGTGKTVTVGGATLNDGNSGGNYNVSYADNTSSTITPKALTYSTAASNKTYDGDNTAAATLSGLTGLIGTETVTASAGATFNTKDVATANLVTVNSATLADGSNGGLASNYSIAAGGTAAANITAKALTYSTAASNKTYDGDNTATATLSGLTGLIGTETVTASAGATFNTKDVATANLVTVNSATLADGSNGGLASNYSIAGGGTAAANITTKALTYSTAASNKTYDGDNTATATLNGLTGLVGTETVTASAGATFNTKDVATANLVTVNSATLADGSNGGLASNYSIAAGGTAAANITPKALTYSTAASNKTYDGDTTATATLSGLTGLIGTETVTATSTGATFNTKDVATANLVTVNSATLADGSNGGLASNYSIAGGGTAAANITAKALTYSTAAANKTYDGDNTAAATLSGLAGLVGTETVTASAGATFNTKDVATANLVTVNTATLANGTNGGLASNYSIAAGGTAAANITAKALTYNTAATNKTYDGDTTASASLNLIGLVNTETLGSTAGATFNTKDVATANLVTVNSATLVDGSNGGLASNYSIAAGGTAAANITAKALTYNTAASNKTYDGDNTATATLSGLTGLVGTETVIGSSTGATFNTKDVATANLVTVNSATLADGTNGGLASNYSIAAGGTAAANITAKALTYSTTASNKTYDGDNTATATLGGLTGLVGTETVTASSTGATFNTKDVATANLVTVNGATLADGTNGGLASNYSIAAGGTAAANITARDLTVTASGVNKVYDGTTAATVGYGDNRLGSDVLSITGAASFADKNAGTGKAVGVSGIALGGTDASNYNLLNTTAGTTASITPKALTVAANNDSKLYDGAAYSGGNGVNYSGFVAGETVAVLSGALAYGGNSQGASAAGNYAITPGGYSATNYTLAYVDGVLNIRLTSAGAAAVGGTALVSAYDGALQAVTGIGGALGGGGGNGEAGAGTGGSSGGDAGALAAAAAEASNTGEDE